MNASNLAVLAAILTAFAANSTGRADPAPAKPPAPANATSIGEVRVQSLQAYSYAYVSTKTSLIKLQDAISTLMPKIDAAMDAGKLRPMGPMIFTYHGATGDPNQQFTLDIGIIVKDPAQKPDGIQLIAIPARSCATVLFSGPVSALGDAYGKLFAEIGKRGLQPAGVTREAYLYWEGDQSANNIVQVQADLAPTN